MQGTLFAEMLPAINFDRQMRVCAKEVEHEPAKFMLPPKLVARELATAQEPP